MHFEQNVLDDAQFGGFVVDDLKQVFGVHRMDEQGRTLFVRIGEQFEQVTHFVGLQVSDEVPVDVGG